MKKINWEKRDVINIFMELLFDISGGRGTAALQYGLFNIVKLEKKK